MAVVETFQVDFVEIDPGMDVFEDLRSCVAVGDVGGEQSGFAGFAENGYRPLAGDQGLVIGADYDFCTLGLRVFYQQFGIGFQRRGDGVRVAQGLRGYPVLTVGAMQIAAKHSETVGQGSGVRVEEGLLFDWVTLHSRDVAPGGVERAFAVEADFTDSGLAFGDGAAVAAGVAADSIAV